MVSLSNVMQRLHCQRVLIRHRMQSAMARLHHVATGSPIGRLFRFGLFQGLRSVEIDPEDFRDYLARKHRLHVSDFSRMHLVPVERLDYIAGHLIKDAQRLAPAGGAGPRPGGITTPMRAPGAW